MKVRVKEGKHGFIYGILKKEGDECTLKEIKSTDGEDRAISVDSQFSKAWMEKVAVKAKPGPKPKA